MRYGMIEMCYDMIKMYKYANLRIYVCLYNKCEKCYNPKLNRCCLLSVFKVDTSRF